MKVTSHLGQHISPGFHLFETVRTEIKQVWFCGFLVSHEEIEIPEEHGLHIPDPGLDGPEEDDNSWPVRGTFKFADRTWIVVRDDDIGFWGWNGREPHTRQSMLEALDFKHRAAMQEGLIKEWWDLDPTGTVPLQKAIQVSIQDMEAQNKPLMAHLMVDLKFFSSVSQAKKNGWDKPLELGRHELGPKKKRAFVEIIP